MMRILVIEDSRFLRLAIEKVLQKCGHEVTGAADGLTGLRAARNEFPQLILLDMMLPGLDGTAVLKELKKDPSTAAVPVIVLTSLSQQNEEKLTSAGAAAFLEKSALHLDKDVDLSELVRMIKEVGGARSVFATCVAR
ncbi:MAG: response regulator [Terriglobales bacterium]|jgi:twitching motility two-component system response regulator PilH